jgi:hypothetical protein
VNPLDSSKSRPLSLFDARHRFVFSELWEIPAAQSANWTRHMFNGWAVTSILTLQSGFPIRLTSSDDRELMNSFDYETAGEPNQVAPFRRLSRQKSGGYFLDPTSFVDAPRGQIGNAPRTICCGPGIANFDLGVHRTIPLREGTNLEFRTEFFNVFNHTPCFSPDGNITNGATFGQVSRAQNPRLIQLALRQTF